ncbi:sensory histidine kinase in two-component regulatory system wtih KdpE, regulation of potassium translocation (fragment) [Candidatus Competibacter denitrificans Run_A_D11]|uniref:histidine kinase n=1 Tax=Candidatus Competibacter denitrificans Run_A_D11 TaxID=1400863 RepID=W6M606_9GAMM
MPRDRSNPWIQTQATARIDSFASCSQLRWLRKRLAGFQLALKRLANVIYPHQKRIAVSIRPDETSGDLGPLAWLKGYGLALLVSLGVTLVAIPLLPYLDHANLVMLFLLAVVGVAAGYGRGPAVLVAVLNVLSFNFVFVPPTFAFAFDTLQAILTFIVMLIVGLVVGQLTARFRYQAHIARAREERARHLYKIACGLSGAVSVEQVGEVSERCIKARLRLKTQLLTLDDDERLQQLPTQADPPAVDFAIAQQCFDRSAPIGLGTDCLPDAPLLYLPLRAPLRTRGVLVVEPERRQPPSLEQRRLLDTLAVLIAMVLERVHFATVAHRTRVKMEAERERNALLAGLSHDLRTPMTALLGLTETLLLEWRAAPPSSQESLATIREQAARMALMVDNLLEMAKLQAVGEVRLRKDWQSLEELVGSAVRMLEQPLRDHPLRLALEPELPLVNCDAVLIERVLVNLLQNAAKYTPPDAVIGVTARPEADWLKVEVWDEGPGLPSAQALDLFEKFTRGQHESPVPGVGLGLSICRAIIEAHGGHIRAENRPGGGACFTFSLPLEALPPLETEDEPELELEPR